MSALSFSDFVLVTLNVNDDESLMMINVNDDDYMAALFIAIVLRF